ncbi:MAG: VTT domain-containing protein [Thermoleophilia bacterium]|nr:VTT domain-containing protein [Thermoleophilia bacterium]
MEQALADYGLLTLFGIVALQTMGIPGLPGKTALVAAAVLAADGHFQIWQVIALTAAGVTIGGYAGYLWARGGGRRILVGDHALARRLERPLLLTEGFFAAHGPKAVFLARFFPGVKVVAAPAAGLARMPPARFALWHLLGALGFALLFGLTGFYAGKGALALLERLGLYALVPLAFLLGASWLSLRLLKASARAAGLRARLAGEQGEYGPR